MKYIDFFSKTIKWGIMTQFTKEMTIYSSVFRLEILHCF